ncbi:MAG: methyltransferase domain-containing protein [Spirochaetales bacterium]|nr:methyltransferase domain-containing protein [Spirochaetales bacterium]
MDPDSSQEKISRVYRSKNDAEKTYTKMSRTYDLFAGTFEAKYTAIALKHLNIKAGEHVLEIGYGTGQSLKQMAKLLGETGKIYGIDISSGMLKVAEKRLKKPNLLNRVELKCGDAVSLPYKVDKFDAVFMSFTLELFDTPEIPIVLNEIKRVLKPQGRLGLVSMSKEDAVLVMVKLYEWAHRKFPKYADCRPIYVGQSVEDTGFKIQYKEIKKLFGLPVEIIICKS